MRAASPTVWHRPPKPLFVPSRASGWGRMPTLPLLSTFTYTDRLCWLLDVMHYTSLQLTFALPQCHTPRTDRGRAPLSCYTCLSATATARLFPTRIYLKVEATEPQVPLINIHQLSIPYYREEEQRKKKFHNKQTILSSLKKCYLKGRGAGW